MSDNEESTPLESDAIELLEESIEDEPIQDNEPQTKMITIELSDNLEETQLEPAEEDAPSLTHIVINKIDESADAENELSDLVKKNDMIDYKKMDVSYLRTLVITRGLATDTKK